MKPGMPVRTCVGCRATATKDDLLRLVKSPVGVARVDQGGKSPGRGAYVHRIEECIEAAFERGALARALRVSVAEAARLREELKRTR